MNLMIDPTLLAYIIGGFTGFMVGAGFGIWSTASERQITNEHEQVWGDD